ncbi:MAG: hypothetical protein KDA24_03945 [Deltaproteobacteria bacterium]|nr:hypothetical protein [Deltaproteobacteria bacterium]
MAAPPPKSLAEHVKLSLILMGIVGTAGIVVWLWSAGDAELWTVLVSLVFLGFAGMQATRDLLEGLVRRRLREAARVPRPKTARPPGAVRRGEGRRGEGPDVSLRVFEPDAPAELSAEARALVTDSSDRRRKTAIAFGPTCLVLFCMTALVGVQSQAVPPEVLADPELALVWRLPLAAAVIGLAATVVSRAVPVLGVAAGFVSVVSVFGVGLFCVIHLLVVGAAALSGGPASVVAALDVATVVVAYGLTQGVNRRLREPEGEAQPLLVLWVFDPGASTHDLVQVVWMAWGRLGPIYMLQGPGDDLSDVGFLDVLTRGAGTFLIESEAEIEEAVARIRGQRSGSGYAPVAPLRCANSVWKHMVQAALDENPVVLFDVCRFGAERAGCRYEFELLAAQLPAEQVVFLVDDGTDVPMLEKALAEAWREAAPPGPHVTLRAFRADADTAGLQGLAELLSQERAARGLPGMLHEATVVAQRATSPGLPLR